MKIINPTILNVYSCQMCQKEMISDVDLKIREGEYPICSYKCLFRLKYRILKKYPNPLLRVLWNFCYPHIPKPKTRNEALFELTKYFIDKK